MAQKAKLARKKKGSDTNNTLATLISKTPQNGMMSDGVFLAPSADVEITLSPLHSYTKEEVNSMAQSIKNQGDYQAVEVEPKNDKGHYRIVDGNLRATAVKTVLKYPNIKVQILAPSEAAKALERSLVKNIVRFENNPMLLVDRMMEIKKKRNLTLEGLKDHLVKSGLTEESARSISWYKKISTIDANLPDDIKDGIRKGKHEIHDISALAEIAGFMRRNKALIKKCVEWLDKKGWTLAGYKAMQSELDKAKISYKMTGKDEGAKKDKDTKKGKPQVTTWRSDFTHEEYKEGDKAHIFFLIEEEYKGLSMQKVMTSIFAYMRKNFTSIVNLVEPESNAREKLKYESKKET